MEKPFPAYRGPEPFVFVCYAHEDSQLVYPELAWLRGQGINLWYDEGVAAGRNWRGEIGDSLLKAAVVLFYVSRQSLGSDHCNREVNLALDEGKHIVPVYLEEVALTSDLKVGLNRVQALYLASDSDYRRHLLEALGGRLADLEFAGEPAGAAPGRRWLSAIALVGILAVVAIGLWGFPGWDKDDSNNAGSNHGGLNRDDSSSRLSTAAEAGPSAVVDRRPSIAVLPFLNMSSDPEQEYFSDGLAVELISLLASNPELKVISRSSAFAFKGEAVSIDQVAATLGVAHLLEGSVRRAGNTVRITAMLTDAGSGAHLWSESFDRPLDDVFAVQDEIAANVVERLNVTLLETDRRSKPASTDAYLPYLRARSLLGLAGDTASVLEAERLLSASLKADPDYVPALTEMGRLLLRKAQLGLMPDADRRTQARALTQHALKIDPDDPVANAWLGWQLLFDDGELRQAARYYERAVSLDPNHEDILRPLVAILQTFGRFESALALAEYVVELDPLCVICIANLGDAYRIAGRLQEAEAQFRHALTISPAAIVARVHLGQLLLQQGKPLEAQAEFEKLDPAQSYTQALLVGVLYAQGKQAEFDSAFTAFRQRWPEQRQLIADLYAASGDGDRAFELLSELAGSVQGAQELPFGMPIPSSWSAYLDDPRWHAYLEEVGASPERYAAIEFDPPLPPGARPSRL